MKRAARLAKWLRIDVHSHFIPGVDDGVKDTEEALTLLKGLNALGYAGAVTTPHIDSEHYPNDAKHLQQLFDEIQNELETASGMKLYLGAEYMLEPAFLDLLKSEVPLLNWEGHVLIETSNLSAPLFFDEAIYNMQRAGYQPVLAHPERYLYLGQHHDTIDRIKRKGVLFQVTAGALAGLYGNQAKKNARWLLKHDYADFVGSDLHRPRQLERFAKGLNERILTRNKSLPFRNNNLFVVEKKS